MSKHIYRWYQIPGRAMLGVYALGKSLLRDWFPQHWRKRKGKGNP
jgi:hypothetical protein